MALTNEEKQAVRELIVSSGPRFKVLEAMEKFAKMSDVEVRAELQKANDKKKALLQAQIDKLK